MARRSASTGPGEIFRTFAPTYREGGFWPRPIVPGSKATDIKNWTRPDADIPLSELKSWLLGRSSYGLGLLMGSDLPDGTTLGAVDVDHNAYVSVVKALLGDPPCGRIGKKGIAYFVRVRPGVNNKKFSVKNEVVKKYGQVVECLFSRSLLVIPPTIHPDTHTPYRWAGKPLLEVDFNQLPLIEA